MEEDFLFIWGPGFTCFVLLRIVLFPNVNRPIRD